MVSSETIESMENGIAKIVVAINSYDWGLFYIQEKVQTLRENTEV